MEHVVEKDAIDLTLLVCTYNRSKDLRDLLETALAQETDGAFTYEVLVVDNNSTDDTRKVTESYIDAGHARLRYLFEPRQGKSYALNTGLSHIRGRLHVIVDDDQILPSGWAKEIVEAFRLHPEVTFIGGKILPLWQKEPPNWLTKQHWAAIGMSDYGESEVVVDAGNQLCLIGCSFRTEDVLAVGGYTQELGVNSKQIGGTEDLEVLQRLWKAGRKGVYVPDITIQHKAPADRCTRKYHRRWHMGHGAFYAAMRDEDFERSKARFFDIPSHLYKEAFKSTAYMVIYALTGKFDRSFTEETKLRFVMGFARKRAEEFNSDGSSGYYNEIRSLLAFLLRRT
jgi:glycosyltransferase involved in cell wall biosynthesis